MGCTSEIMKCFLNCINTLNGIVAISLIFFATNLRNEAPTAYLCYVYITAGALLIASIIGCCGICRQHVCMTTTYAILVLCILIGQILGKIYTLDSEAIKDIAAKSVDKTWQEELHTPGAMVKTEQTYNCCGRDGPNDYVRLGRDKPKSCYPDMKVNETTIFKIGCVEAAELKFSELFIYSSSSEWVSLGLTAIVCFCAFYLVARFRKQQHQYHY